MNSNINAKNSILSGKILPTLLSISFPIMLNQLLQTMYNISDSYFMGLLGGKALAASAFTFPIFQVITSLGGGIATGGMIIFSRNIGAGKDSENIRAKSQLITVSIVLGIILSIATILFSKQILTFSGAADELLQLSNNYTTILFLSIPAMFVVNCYSSIENSKGNTKKPMLLVFASIVLNLFLNSLAVKFGLGIHGIALATVISNVILAVYCLYSLINNSDIKTKFLPLNLKLALPMVNLGIPVALSSATASLGFVLLNKYVVGFGSEVLAAFGIGNRLNNIFYTPANGIATGISIMISQNLGAGNNKRISEILNTSMKLSIAIATVGSVILFFIRRWMISFFTSDPVIIQHSDDFLKVFLYCNVAWGIYQVYSGYFMGIGLTKLNFYINLGRVWLFRVPVLLLIERLFHLGAYSVWYAMLVSNILVMLLAWMIFSRLDKKHSH